MKYIKDLYAKKPVLVKAWIRKMFDVSNDQRLFEIKSIDDYIDQNCVLLGLIDLKTRDITEIVLGDFAICYGDEYLNIDDKRLGYYLIQMARNCDDNYIQGFHKFRSRTRRNGDIDYNAKTYNMESQMAKAMNIFIKTEDNSL